LQRRQTWFLVNWLEVSPTGIGLPLSGYTRYLFCLSYSVPAWAPYTMADKELLEKVQRRAIIMVSNIKGPMRRGWKILG
jgi:hypothetical protein